MARGKYITPAQVDAVKAIDKAKPGVKTKVLANLLGVSDSTIQAIRRGEYDKLHMKELKKNLEFMSRLTVLLAEVVESMEGDC